MEGIAMGKLAIKGGVPVIGDIEKIIPPWPIYGESERAALGEVLDSGIWGTMGPRVEAFCKRFAAYQGAPYGIAVNNGTVSMEIALRGLGIGRGDEVIIPPYSFYATASCVIMVGATPVFADIDGETVNISPESVERAITPRTKAIIPVHLSGVSCDMDRIMSIAREHKLFVIEDTAQANGSEWTGRKLGTFGDAGSFSFQASKNLNAGEGGFLIFREKGLYEKCWSIHNCGRDIHGGGWHDHTYVSTNARMTEWQAAILDTQMNKMDRETDVRIKNAERLTKELSRFPFIRARKSYPGNNKNIYYSYIFMYQKEHLKGLSKEKFLEALKAEGFPWWGGYIPMYKQPVFASEEFRRVTGSEIKYNGRNLPNVEKGARDELVYIGLRFLLGGEKAINTLVEAMGKIQENIGELL
jgi:dTDP-4-amino-4,6-dideoxygalactose transaminase